MSSTLLEVMGAIAGQLQTELGAELDDLQVTPLLNFNPTPPAIDVYPADPFEQQTTYGARNREPLFTIRARVSTADSDGGQELLLDLMDPGGALSVVQALAGDKTLGGKAATSVVEALSGFIVYTSASGDPGQNLLGCEWRLRVGL